MVVIVNLYLLILYLLSCNSVICADFDIALGLLQKIYMASLKCTALIDSFGHIHGIFRPCHGSNG
jgi:hypothetical protein